MKFVTLSALVVGVGAKAETLAPGMETTAAKCKLSTEECHALHGRGVIRIIDGLQAATKNDDAVGESPAE